jgi:nitrite reductase/ring-hydroxylating ferredoxin subunit
MMKKIPEGFTKICKLSDLKEEQGKQFFIDDVEIAVFKVQDNIYSLSNICPHQKTHLMHEGFIEKGMVGCPIHGWMFDLKTGNLAGGRKGLTSFETLVIDNEVYVKVIKKEPNW